MLLFSQYLNEAYDKLAKSQGVGFKLASDVDFIGSRSLISFTDDEKDNYIIDGRTSGTSCHAYKHLDLFKASFIDKELDKTRKLLADYASKHAIKFDEVTCIVNNKNIELKKGESISEFINKAPRDAIINFLDLVNDKLMQRDGLIGIETCVIPILKELSDKYCELIKNYTDKSIVIRESSKLDHIKKAVAHGTFSFKVESKSNPTKDVTTLCVSKPDNVVIVTKTGAVCTMFKPNENVIDWVLRKYNISNKNLHSYLKR